MRFLALFTLTALGMLHSACALVDARYRTDVDVDSDCYDTRDSGDGCSPDGCKPSLTRDRKYYDSSRWSCSRSLGCDCKIYYYFDEPQDIEKVCFALWKGDERERNIKMTFYDSDGDTWTKTFYSSGDTEDYECIDVYTDETEKIRMEPSGLSYSDWLSITEVEFRVK